MPTLIIRVTLNPTDAEGNPLLDETGKPLPERTSLEPDGFPNRLSMRAALLTAQQIVLNQDAAEFEKAMEQHFAALAEKANLPEPKPKPARKKPAPKE